MLLERETRLVVVGKTAHGITIKEVTRQAAIPSARSRIRRIGRHVQRRRRRALSNSAFHAADPERIAGVLEAGRVQLMIRIGRIERGEDDTRVDQRRIRIGAVNLRLARLRRTVRILVHGGHGDAARHRRKRLAWKRHNRWNGRASEDLAIRQCAGANGGFAAFERKRITVETVRFHTHIQNRAGFERVMVAPHRPHALREVRVIVAVEDGVASRLVSVARATERDLERIGAARADALCVVVVRVVVVRVRQPLVVVEVENVVLFRTCVQVPEFHEIADVRMRDVGRIIRILRIGRADRRIAFAERIARLRRAELETCVYGHVDQHGRIADSKRGQEELFIVT